MKTIWYFLVQKKNLLIMGTPLAGAMALSLFTLRPFVREALIGIVLIWLQLTFILSWIK